MRGPAAGRVDVGWSTLHGGHKKSSELGELACPRVDFLFFDELNSRRVSISSSSSRAEKNTASTDD